MDESSRHPEVPSTAGHDPIAEATNINAALQNVSDMLLGAVAMMEREGWSQDQARQIVVATYVSAMRMPQ